MNLEEIKITNHACLRFQERHKKVFGQVNSAPYKEIAFLLKDAIKSSPDPKHHIERLLRYKDSYCEFYTNKGWRFLIDPYKNALITCERVINEEN